MEFLLVIGVVGASLIFIAWSAKHTPWLIPVLIIAGGVIAAIVIGKTP